MGQPTSTAAGIEPAAVPRREDPAPTRPRSRDDRWWAWLLIAPTTLGLVAFYLWPVLQTFYFSFTEWGAFGGSTWAGLENYGKLFEDEKMLGALRNTVVYAGLTTVVGVPLATVVAVLLNQRGLRGAGAYRTLYFLPVVTMPAAVALIWGYLYNGDFGLINYALSLIGIDGPFWVSDGRVALYALVAVGIWTILGYNMVILLAGLQAIPTVLYEAAEIDGAGPVRKFFSVTVPMLSPTLFFVTIMSSITTLQMFDLIYVMIGHRNPALPDTRTVVYLFFEHGFVENERGYAAAIAFVLLAIILLLTAVQFRLQKKWVHYA